MPIRVIVVGAGGRMGGEVVRLLSQQKDITLVAGVEAVGHPLLGTPIGSGFVVADLKDVLSQTDVVVDFSAPGAAIENVRVCADGGKPFITGVTGFSDIQIQELKNAGKQVPVVYAPNFSVGIAVLNKLVSEAVELLGENYEIHIIETHHKKKRDAPSGTAKMLIATIKAKMKEKQIGVSSIRTGDVVGEHIVIFGGPGERVELIHKAESRVAFAAGVITAIRFIVNRPPGFYSMADILNIT